MNLLENCCFFFSLDPTLVCYCMEFVPWLTERFFQMTFGNFLVYKMILAGLEFKMSPIRTYSQIGQRSSAIFRGFASLSAHAVQYL